MNRIKRMMHGAVYGTKGKLATKAERPLARHSPLSRDAIRTGFGALFLFLSARTLLRALRAAFR